MTFSDYLKNFVVPEVWYEVDKDIAEDANLKFNKLGFVGISSLAQRKANIEEHTLEVLDMFVYLVNAVKNDSALAAGEEELIKKVDNVVYNYLGNLIKNKIDISCFKEFLMKAFIAYVSNSAKNRKEEIIKVINSYKNKKCGNLGALMPDKMPKVIK